MKAIKCDLYLGTSTKFFKFATFESISKAKRYIAECGINCYKEIVKHK